jgi:hypothetical protein
MRLLRIIGTCLVIAVTAGAVTTATAGAARLTLTTARQGALASAAMTWTSANSSLTFGDEEATCPVNPLQRLKWKVTVDQEGSKYVGQVLGESALECALPSGAPLTIEPDPHPWSVKLTGAGKSPIKGIGQKPQLIVNLAESDQTCTFQTGKLSFVFAVAGPLHPIPLEPGDPQPLAFKLDRAISSVGCPMTATEKLSFDAAVTGPNGEEEPVLDE